MYKLDKGKVNSNKSITIAFMGHNHIKVAPEAVVKLGSPIAQDCSGGLSSNLELLQNSDHGADTSLTEIIFPHKCLWVT